MVALLANVICFSRLIDIVYIYMDVVWYNSVRAEYPFLLQLCWFLWSPSGLTKNLFNSYMAYIQIFDRARFNWFDLIWVNQVSFHLIRFDLIKFIFIHEIDRTNFTCKICQYKLYCTVNSVRNVFYIYSPPYNLLHRKHTTLNYWFTILGSSICLLRRELVQDL